MTALLLAAFMLLSAPATMAEEKGEPSLSSAVGSAQEGNEASALSEPPEESGEAGAPESGPDTESSAVSEDPDGPETSEGGMSSGEVSEGTSSGEASEGMSSGEASEGTSSGEALEGTEAGTFAENPLLVVGGHLTYLSGYGGGYFKPEAAMTRAEVAKMLYNLLAAKPAVSTSRFSDVKLTSWYGKEVNALAEVGVLDGYGNGTFRPNVTITRAEFVKALSMCFSLDAGTADFPDVSEKNWAYKYIASAVSKGWISGYEDGTFRPEKKIKRCEAVKIVNVALGRKDEDFALDRNVQKFRDVPKSHWAFLDIAEAAEPENYDPTPIDPEPSGDVKVGDSVRVTADSGLNLRASPNTTSNVVTVLSNGASLTVTEITDATWIKVKTSNSLTGYVHSAYVEVYVPGQASGAKLSASSLSLHQYQTARLDASVSTGLDSMKWTSSDPSVAVVGYTVGYGSREEGGMVYGKSPGTATITFTDEAGTAKAACTVTVTAAEAVRFAYGEANIAAVGEKFNLIAVTDTGRAAVKFQVVNGSAYETAKFTTESRNSSYGLPANSVRVFKQEVSFTKAGTYTVRAASKGSGGYSSDSYEFTVLVTAASAGSTATSAVSRRASTEMLKVIANFEGSVPEIEDDVLASKNPTVGYGYVVPVNGCFYNNLTSTELFALLADKVNNGGYTSGVNNFRANNGLKMSQAQFDALVSFVYNLGPGVLSTEYGTFRVMLNAVTPPSDASGSKPYTGTLNVGDAEILKGPSTDSDRVETVKNGKTVSVIGSKVIRTTRQQEVWYQVKYGSKTGWMSAGYIQLSASNLTHDLAYADSTVLANNFLQWNKAGSTTYAGLVWRRMAEAKIFFYGNYAEAYHTHSDYEYNTYGFDFPQGCEGYDKRR